ncbi:MAG: hypothetical protein OJF47_002497 [Nitrospira sp.]|nr:MAG: hypothetical protein OJF47_002497 [Nitrospira sp.]
MECHLFLPPQADLSIQTEMTVRLRFIGGRIDVPPVQSSHQTMRR